MKKTLFLLIFFAPMILKAQEFKINPKVIDGDSITIKIRLHGIDAPEHDQPYGKKAKEFLESLVKNKEVLCYKKAYDGYGRTVAECFADDVNINAKMVENGYAFAYKQYAKDYVKLENYAKENKLGIWQQKNIVFPWDYRKIKRDKNIKKP